MEINNLLKQLKTKAIELRNDLFLKARIKLTIIYLSLIVFLLFIFSAILFIRISQDSHNDFNNLWSRYQQVLPNGQFLIETNTPPPSAEQSVEADNNSQLKNTIIFSDINIFIIAGLIFFFLSGGTLKPIEENHETQKRFIADASHELRTPLSLMKTNLEVSMKDYANNKEVYSTLEFNLEEVDRMAKIIEDLLVLSRVDSHQEKLSFSKVEVNSLVNESINKISKIATNKNIELTYKGAKDSLYVNGDKNKLMQAIINIIKNAVEYSDDDSKVQVHVLKDGTFVNISIKDSGIGISKDDLTHIFERFYRADKSRSKKVDGNGLGLAITKWIIEQHNGDIAVKSVLDKGSEFVIKLPLLKE